MDVKPEVPSQTTAASPVKRVIKRYSNRKLYDTKDSKYVTLLQIAEMVRGGEEVQIIDNNSKEDLTEVTLAQIIYEEKKANSRAVPLQTLKDLIHTRTEKVLSDLRESPIGKLIPGVKEKDKVPEEVPEPTPSKPGVLERAQGTLEDWQMKIDERIRAMLPSSSPWQQLEAEVKRLNARIDELEKKLKSAKNRDD